MAENEPIDDLERLVRERVEAEAAEKKKKEKPSEPAGIDLDFVEKCFNANEVGDSLLYNRIHRGKFVNNVNAKYGWMQFDGHIWRQDLHQKARAAVEEVVKEYLRLMEKTESDIKEFEADEGMRWLVRGLREKKKKIMTRVNKLRSDKGRGSVLSCSISNADPLTVEPARFDLNPWLFPCANGVMDLRTMVFRTGTPEDYLTLSSDIPWEGWQSPCTGWEKFLLEILDNDAELVAYLQRILGYTCTGQHSERLFVVFYGPHGQNGKGTIIEVLHHIFGKLSDPMQTEMLMSQKFTKSPSGPTPEVLALKGKRMVWASETEKHNSFASGKIKLYSGGDQLLGRHLQDRDQTYFWPTHVMFLLCNDLPKAPAQDEAFWTRIKVFTFPFSYVPIPTEPHQRSVDRNINETLKAEAPGILAWLFKGCLDWQKEGLNPPKKVLDDSLKYREHEDDLQDFLDECCLIDKGDHSVGNRTPANDLYKRFKVWWSERNSYKPMPQKDFSDKLQLKGFQKVKSDKIFYLYIKLFFTFPDDGKGGSYG